MELCVNTILVFICMKNLASSLLSTITIWKSHESFGISDPRYNIEVESMSPEVRSLDSVPSATT